MYEHLLLLLEKVHNQAGSSIIMVYFLDHTIIPRLQNKNGGEHRGQVLVSGFFVRSPLTVLHQELLIVTRTEVEYYSVQVIIEHHKQSTPFYGQ